MTSPGRFEGRTAIVTGSASGVGRATALQLAAEGAAVGCLDVADAVEDTVAAIADDGGRATAARVDVRDEASVAAAVAAVRDDLGDVDVLANVAGVLRFAHTHEQSVEDWDLVMDVNLKGTFLMCREVLPMMLAAGRGSIVNVASSAGMFGQAYNAAYGASKGGVVLLTKSMAWEYVKQGVRVNAVAPGGVDTPMTSAVAFPDEADFSLMRKCYPPNDVMMPPTQPAGLIAFLASDDAAFITGTVVPVDGGITC